LVLIKLSGGLIKDRGRSLLMIFSFLINKCIEDKEEKARSNSFVVFQDRNEIKEGGVSLVRDEVGSLQKILEAALFEDHRKSIALRAKGKSMGGRCR
jgi:hypothetical protein